MIIIHIRDLIECSHELYGDDHIGVKIRGKVIDDILWPGRFIENKNERCLIHIYDNNSFC